MRIENRTPTPLPPLPNRHSHLKEFAGIIVIATLVMVVGGFFLAQSIIFVSTAESATATVIDAGRYSPKHNRSAGRSPMVEFFVDGVRYTAELPEKHAGIVEGSQITVYYQPHDPGAKVTQKVSFGAVFAVLFGGLINFLVIFTCVKADRREQLGLGKFDYDA